MHKERRWRSTWQSPLDRQTDCQNRHERLIRHWIDDSANDGLQPPMPRNVAIDKVADAGVREETNGPDVLIVQDEVANDRGREQTRKGQDVGNRIDVFVGRQARQDALADFLDGSSFLVGR